MLTRDLFCGIVNRRAVEVGFKNQGFFSFLKLKISKSPNFRILGFKNLLTYLLTYLLELPFWRDIVHHHSVYKTFDDDNFVHNKQFLFLLRC